MNKIFFFILISIFFLTSCAASKKNIQEKEAKTFLVKVINSSFEKVLLRNENDDSSYSFRFVDPENSVKFSMRGNLIIQFSMQNYDDAKIIRIEQDTLIHVKKDDLLIDDLPKEEKDDFEKKKEKTK